MMRSSVLVKQDIEAAELEIRTLREEEIQLDQRRTAIQDKLRELGFGRADRGKLVELHAELTRTERFERDSPKGRVVWDIAPDSRPYVIESITKSRLLVRALGSEKVLLFDVQGRPVNEWAKERINVSLTLANFAEAMGDDVVELA